ncbi:MAG: hypothetical protein WC378_08830 [Opitutaceae bacterium]|jgi:hypothetical protein
MSAAIKSEIADAINEVRLSFSGHQVDIEPDNLGGAFVRVHEVDLGPVYKPFSTWIGFQITFQYPFADVYPHYIRPDIVRADGQAFVPPFHLSHTFALPSGGVNAVMVSRRSNHRDPITDTAVVKLAKVLDWIRSR